MSDDIQVGRPQVANREATPEQQMAIGLLATELAQLIARIDSNFIQGNPTVVRMPVELRNSDLVVVLQLTPRARSPILLPPTIRQ